MIVPSAMRFFSFLRPSNIRKWFDIENVFVNYFWLYFISGVVFTIIGKNWLFTLGWPMVIFLMFYKNLKRVSINAFDLLWICVFIWIVLSWIVNDFPNKTYIILRSFINDIAFMFAYWISRNGRSNYIHQIYKESSKPLLLACLIGLYCYFVQPDWYMNKTVDYLSEVYDDYQNKLNSLEFFRLRSVFSSTYSMAYYCAIILIGEFYYIFNATRKTNDNYRYHWCYIMVLALCSIFCMMRGPIVGALLGFCFALFYSYKYSRRSKSVLIVLIIGFFVLVSYSVVSSFVGMDTLDFLVSKFEEVSDKDSNFLIDRLTLQSDGGGLELMGDGYGKYSAAANDKGMRSIPDAEYMKIVEEQGIVGLVLTTSLFGVGLFKSLKHFKYLFFEFSIILMLMICMFGADPLTIPDKHCFVYWLALGQIARYSPRNKNVNELWIK